MYLKVLLSQMLKLPGQRFKSVTGQMKKLLTTAISLPCPDNNKNLAIMLLLRCPVAQKAIFKS